MAPNQPPHLCRHSRLVAVVSTAIALVLASIPM